VNPAEPGRLSPGRFSWVALIASTPSLSLTKSPVCWSKSWLDP
jgi:hypothetical protein